MLTITLTTAGALALLNFWHSLRIATLRSSENIWVGDGGHPKLLARMRGHANFAEYTPIILILIGLIEATKGTHLWLAVVAGLFVLGRICHALGMDGWKPGRMIGMACTAPIMIGLGIYAIAIPWL
ncbi:MAPEG family protein [Allosphingosinicella sp.]|uniref:MAPEG family protein n=1 Tax=Allosphingosinicella sp. TaxID=2823234 RepID=UPI00378409AC